MASKHPFGDPVNAVKFVNNQIVYEEDKLSKILLHPEVKNREVVLFAIVGSYRKGKSFFMDYCLRFLYANYKSINNPNNPINKENWIGLPDDPLTGFSWRSGSVRDTTGVSFWSDVFLYDPQGGDPTALILLDTQGLFDPETSTEENVKILSLGTLFSSTIVLNLTNVIQEDQLQYLQFTTEYATYIKSSTPENIKPFQKFLFLIRDWQNIDDYDFGFEGGQRYLTEVLKTKAEQADELRKVREHIHESFDQLLCFLMPYPGKKVASSAEYDGRWSLMDDEFVTEMKNLIENFFKPENLVVKKIDGVDIKAHELFEFITGYISAFSASGSIPKPKSLYELTVGKFLTQVVNECFEIYEKNLKSVDRREDIDMTNDFAKSKALKVYIDAKKMGGSEYDEKYKKKLETKIEQRELEWKNSMKNHFDQIDEEKKKSLEIAEEIERLRKLEEESDLKKKEEEVRKQIEENERELARQQEELRKRQLEIEEEQRKQKEAQEAIERERERQRQLEEERRRQEEQARIDEEERKRIKVQIDELGIKFHIPKPRCSVM